MTDASFSKRVSFAYLEELKEFFIKKFDEKQIQSAITYGLNSAFHDIIKNKTVFYLKI